jgi:hypothetical protein
MTQGAVHFRVCCGQMRRTKRSGSVTGVVLGDFTGVFTGSGIVSSLSPGFSQKV